jgi:3-oxoacyl-(acyl-carrier-protein) synthase
MTVPGVPDPIGAQIPDFDPSGSLAGRNLSLVSLASRYAHQAAAEALAMAARGSSRDPRSGVYVGTAFGGIQETEDVYRVCFTPPGGRPRPTSIPLAMANAPAGFLASEFQLRGPNLTFSTACASAAHAIGEAFRAVRSGESDVVLAGGVDAPLTPVVIAAWGALRVLAPAGEDPARACRPFSADREGIVVGEGAGFLILEGWERALTRGAEILAEVVGFGRNADAGHPTHPDPAGVKECLRLALDDAGLSPDAVGYVNAHGTATPANDAVEAESLAAVLGERESLLVSSTKAAHGHAMGASPALEAIATILALRHELLPPTANLHEADPKLPRLGYVKAHALGVPVEYALSNSLAFGGNNAVLALKRPPGPRR